MWDLKASGDLDDSGQSVWSVLKQVSEALEFFCGWQTSPDSHQHGGEEIINLNFLNIFLFLSALDVQLLK